MTLHGLGIGVTCGWATLIEGGTSGMERDVSSVTQRRLGSQRGQATVEFAIVLPLVLLLVVGIIEFGKAFNYWLSLNHIASETARWAAVDKLPPDNATPTVDQLKTYAREQAQNQELRDQIAPENVTICYEPSADSAPPRIGDAATVKIRVPYNLPVISSLAGLNITLAGTSTVRLEQLPSPGSGWDLCAQP
jgi:Flp pilus assembly protein TadG